MESIINAPDAGPSTAELVKDVTTATFMQDVVEASQETPVIVDLWAPWCGPCKQLGPILEKVVTEARGAVRMVKLNIDENPEVAQQMRVQSIPAVFAFVGGRPVDGFAGALPESQVKAFVERVIEAAGTAQSSPLDEALAQAGEFLEANDYESAASLLSQILQHDAENVPAKAGLIRCLIAAGDTDQARALLASIPEDRREDAEVATAASALELAEKAADAGDLDQIRAKLEANANDHQARYELALALYAVGERAEAIDQLVEIVRRDRSWNDEAARKELLQFFEAIGPTDPVTVDGRRKLSSVLFS